MRLGRLGRSGEDVIRLGLPVLPAAALYLGFPFVEPVRILPTDGAAQDRLTALAGPPP